MRFFIELMFSEFWNFIGGLIIIMLILQFIGAVFNRFFRHWNIRKHGYPPHHCDADGDFKKDDD